MCQKGLRALGVGLIGFGVGLIVSRFFEHEFTIHFNNKRSPQIDIASIRELM